MPPVARPRRARAAACAAALAASLAAGCGSSGDPAEVAAAPTEAAAPAAPVARSADGAVAVARRAASAGAGMPDVTGGDLDAARAALSAVDARGAALVFADDAVVTAQFPAPGQAVPAEADVLLWVGAPAGVTVEVVDEVTPLAATATGADLDPSAPAVEPGATEPAGDAGAAGVPQPGTPQPGGLASWYGPGFEGDLTPCGERVDPDAVTFAGPDLPCGTRVRVTGPDGAVVEAVLTDRGPAAWTGRRYNLSRAAFDEIADLATGVVPVRVEALD